MLIPDLAPKPSRSVPQTAKHGLEGLEIAGRPAHIEFWTPPGAAYLPLPMVAAPAPPPPPLGGWSSAPTAAPSSPSAYMGMFPAPSPSYGSYRCWRIPKHMTSCCCMLIICAKASTLYTLSSISLGNARQNTHSGFTDEVVRHDPRLRARSRCGNTYVYTAVYSACSPGSGPSGSGEYVAVGYQPVALSRSNSADYGMSLGGGVMAAYSWAPYGGSYPMYPGVSRRTWRQWLQGMVQVN